MRASILLVVILFWTVGSCLAAEPPRCPEMGARQPSHAVRPASSDRRAQDTGRRTHTNVEIFMPPGQAPKPPPASLYKGNRPSGGYPPPPQPRPCR